MASLIRTGKRKVDASIPQGSDGYSKFLTYEGREPVFVAQRGGTAVLTTSYEFNVPHPGLLLVVPFESLASHGVTFATVLHASGLISVTLVNNGRAAFFLARGDAYATMVLLTPTEMRFF